MLRMTLYGALFALTIHATGGVAGLLEDQRTAAALRQGIDPHSQVIELEADGTGFVAILRPAALPERRGAAILLHDQRTTADSGEVIGPLRHGLAAAGWDTLALQLPTGTAAETRTDWLDRRAVVEARLDAAAAWLKARGIERIATIALGDSGAIALQHAARQSAAPPGALVLISATLDADGETGTLTTLGTLRLPLLDVYAERDLAAVVDNAPARRRAAGDGGHSAYRQMTIAGATPGFDGVADRLTRRIGAWLAAQTDR